MLFISKVTGFQNQLVQYKPERVQKKGGQIRRSLSSSMRNFTWFCFLMRDYGCILNWILPEQMKKDGKTNLMH